MAKTDVTLQLERDIYAATNKMGVFGCFEVTIGWYGEQRVDYMTYDTKGVFRCYEIKVSKSDYKSNAHNTFVGHYNYYVMTRELYDQVVSEIPAHVGVYVFGSCMKRARKQELGVGEEILKNSLIRSLSRDVGKLLKSNNPDYVNRMNRLINNERREKENYREKYFNLLRESRN
ncbi:hypothetical protein [Paenibacillus terrae]|uniref:Uncharacterized protein n=1 Tax=Paenibacillus terrae TaxID=159743 RepID=A0A0D7WYE1_9BACL|nr:hypothetical protein [Paenibacillus terrae]KJD44195.1 hypothetical protein QD47_18520 [Paenibacillus terrae]